MKNNAKLLPYKNINSKLLLKLYGRICLIIGRQSISENQEDQTEYIKMRKAVKKELLKRMKDVVNKN